VLSRDLGRIRLKLKEKVLIELARVGEGTNGKGKGGMRRKGRHKGNKIN